MHQPFHDVRIVVDAFEQDGLRAEWHAGIGQHSTGCFDCRSQFVRVIEVQIHINRVVLLYDRAELRGNPFR